MESGAGIHPWAAPREGTPRSSDPRAAARQRYTLWTVRVIRQNAAIAPMRLTWIEGAPTSLVVPPWTTSAGPPSTVSRFSGKARFVDRAPSVEDRGLDGDALACSHAHDLTRLSPGELYLGFNAVPQRACSGRNQCQLRPTAFLT